MSIVYHITSFMTVKERFVFIVFYLFSCIFSSPIFKGELTMHLCCIESTAAARLSFQSRLHGVPRTDKLIAGPMELIS